MLQRTPPDDALLKQSPWLVTEKRFSKINDLDQIKGILKGLKDRNSFLTITTSDDVQDLFFDSFLLDVGKKSIRLYRSPKWPENGVDSCRIFFKNSLGVWYSMKGDIDWHDTHSISVSLPATLHILRQRSCRRLEVPENTRAAFFYGNRHRSSFQVLNVSHNGALLCSGNDSKRLPVMSRLNDIIIDQPEGIGLPTVRHGQIVRIFKGRESNKLCYGVLFKDNGEVNEKTVWDFISSIR